MYDSVTAGDGSAQGIHPEQVTDDRFGAQPG
jgi:hypothetical protein